MDPLEIVAVVLGLANIALLVRRSIWNYPFGMAMVALYAVIFFDARLYGEAGLQGFFFVIPPEPKFPAHLIRRLRDGGVTKLDRRQYPDFARCLIGELLRCVQ